MDIAKYIGLFLLKNNFCYVPGRVNLEFKKITATHDGNALKAPSYEVRVTPSGSIDDSLANFIATNEKISISSASNAMRTFATESKVILQKGEPVSIPSLGHFIEQDGKMQFVTDPNFKYTPAAIPTIKHAPKAVDNIKPITTHKPIEPAYNKESDINWGKTILVGLAIGVVTGLAVGGFLYISKPSAETTVVATKTEEPKATITETIPTTEAVPEAVSPATAAPVPGQYKVIINTYNTQAKAEKRQSKLTSYGNTVELIAKDSTTFHLVIPISASTADTARMLDSLRRTFNPEGVSIYR